MDENFTRGYVQLQLDSPGAAVSLPNRKNSDDVKDKCSCIYIAFVLCGAGFLLPYNSFITAVDFYQNKYPGTTIVFDMSLTYICVALFGVTLNNLLVNVLRLHTRITFAYVLSFTTLLLVALCDIWYDVFTHNVSYIVTLVAVGIVALGCTVQQSSFYGYTSMLPSRYTQAVMTGESAAGLIISINRIVTKALLPGRGQENTIIFFVLSIVMIMVCCAIFHITRKSDFVKHHITMCRLSAISDEQRKAHGIHQLVTEEVSLVDILDGNAHHPSHDGYGVLSFNISPSSPPIDAYQKFENPSFSFTDNADKSEGVNHQTNNQAKLHFKGTSSSQHTQITTFGKIKNGFHIRWRVAKTVWPYMISIGLAYFVTLCLFPGIESEVVSCKYGSWMPVILISVFNLFDFIGKIFASIRYEWPRARLVILTCLRLVLVPLLMMCASPRYRPLLHGEFWPIFLSVLLGLSNGYFGSVPMIIAPTKVADSQKEITGNIMMLSYSIGLTTGSIVAYFLDIGLGPHLNRNICETFSTNANILYNTSTVSVFHESTYTPLMTTALQYAGNISYDYTTSLFNLNSSFLNT